MYKNIFECTKIGFTLAFSLVGGGASTTGPKPDGEGAVGGSGGFINVKLNFNYMKYWSKQVIKIFSDTTVKIPGYTPHFALTV
jgi:hypothetical protein